MQLWQSLSLQGAELRRQTQAKTKEETQKKRRPEGIPKDEIKVGFVHISDPSDMGYTYNHDLGTKEMQKELGLSDDQIINKYCRKMQNVIQLLENS